VVHNANGPGNGFCCYSELTVSSLAVVIKIASTHYAKPRTDGQAELAWVAWLNTKTAHPRACSHPDVSFEQFKQLFKTFLFKQEWLTVTLHLSKMTYSLPYTLTYFLHGVSILSINLQNPEVFWRIWYNIHSSMEKAWNLSIGVDNIVHIEQISPPVILASIIQHTCWVSVSPEWTITEVWKQWREKTD